MEKVYITKGNYSGFETFLEQVCDKYHLYNYIGAIDIAIEKVLEVAQADVLLSASNTKEGICFSFEAKESIFSKISFSDRDNPMFDTLFIIKNLSDYIQISEDGKVMNLYFYINGIEEELVIKRRENIKSYSSNKLSMAK